MTTTAPVLIMAGGTGGHIFPGLAVAECLRAQGVPVVWLGADGGMETKVVPAQRIELRTVAVGGLRGKGLKTRLLAPLMLVRALFASLRVLREVRPRSVLSMGGYVAGPGGVAAWLLRRPLLVHEQNRVAGFTNRKLAGIATRVMAGFADALPGAEWVGNPVRAAITALPVPAVRMAERAGRPRLLVLGGSLGARALNLALPQALAQLPLAQRPEVVHQCGSRGLDEARQAYANAGVDAQVVAFIDDMAASYGWADLAVCRAGALTLAELTAAGLDTEIWQCPVVLLADVRSVGVQGDGRTYGHPIVLRPVSSEDAMTADWTRLPYDVLAKISNRITNEVPGVNRVVLDVTSKPPGTIEWE